MRLLVATKNRGKVREIKKISKDYISILSPLDIGLNIDILEDGKTLRENSLKKALEYFRKANICTIGEDTGLFVETLGGKPGVYSARYGEGGDENNRKKLLSELKGKKNRKAYFQTVITLVINENWYEFFEGKIRGKITEKELGDGGFGYDSIFLPEGSNKTFAQMSEKAKNNISHRKIALKKVLDFIEEKKEKISILCE
jgi:XTP/dITP diphosphohydrolase